jgi:predicted NACHT family NTPase
LSRWARLVVLGDPGAGKTMLLKYITLSFAEGQSQRLGLNEARLPIFIRLQDYVARRANRCNDYALVDYVYS